MIRLLNYSNIALFKMTIKIYLNKLKKGEECIDNDFFAFICSKVEKTYLYVKNVNFNRVCLFLLFIVFFSVWSIIFLDIPYTNYIVLFSNSNNPMDLSNILNPIDDIGGGSQNPNPNPNSGAEASALGHNHNSNRQQESSSEYNFQNNNQMYQDHRMQDNMAAQQHITQDNMAAQQHRTQDNMAAQQHRTLDNMAQNNAGLQQES